MFSVLNVQFSERFKQGEVFQPKPRLDKKKIFCAFQDLQNFSFKSLDLSCFEIAIWNLEFKILSKLDCTVTI